MLVPLIQGTINILGVAGSATTSPACVRPLCPCVSSKFACVPHVCHDEPYLETALVSRVFAQAAHDEEAVSDVVDRIQARVVVFTSSLWLIIQLVLFIFMCAHMEG